MTIIHFYLINLLVFFILGYLLGKPNGVDLRNATEELQELDGVGKKTAKRIVKYLKSLQ